MMRSFLFFLNLNTYCKYTLLICLGSVLEIFEMGKERKQAKVWGNRVRREKKREEKMRWEIDWKIKKDKKRKKEERKEKNTRKI